MTRGTILIANDSPVATRVSSSLFGREGYSVRTANGGGEALTAVKREAPDLVIFDVELPDMDGFELCRRIRTQPALRGVPVLALSPTAPWLLPPARRTPDERIVSWLSPVPRCGCKT